VRTLFCLLVILAGFLYAQPGEAATPEARKAYRDRLISEAAARGLHEERYWHLLLKYRKTTFGGYESEADGMGFFNSPAGKTDPEKELAATLASFFTAPEDLKENSEHPQCDFPARFKWLSRKLDFDFELLPREPCDRLTRWRGILDPVGVTVVFASHFLNNPASMFGHTLLRVDSKRTGADKKLLNYGANYAARPDTENAVLYALKGLVGLFQGHYTIFPYYTKVQEYNNWESRDLWEYELNLSEDQLDDLLFHLWELGGTYFNYYYFQENCSYHILSLIEVADPSLHLREQFFFSVIPADTVKALTAEEGLVKRAVYRPAVLSQMNQKRIQMSETEKRTLQAVVNDPAFVDEEAFNTLPEASRALVLDAALDYMQYKSMQAKAPDQALPRNLLLARSRLNHQRESREAVEFSTRPDLGHGADRLRFGAGLNDHEPFQEIAYRPAYHDLLAKDTGYARDSEIIFLDFQARYYDETERLVLERAHLLGITSLNAYDPLFAKPSWRLGLLVDTMKDFDCPSCNSFRSHFGMGAAYRPVYFSPLLLYGFIDAEAEFADKLEDTYRLGGDGELGGRRDLGEHWKIGMKGAYKYCPLGDDKGFFTAAFEQRFSLSRDLDLRLEYRRSDDHNEGVLALNFYF